MVEGSGRRLWEWGDLGFRVARLLGMAADSRRRTARGCSPDRGHQDPCDLRSFSGAGDLFCVGKLGEVQFEGGVNNPAPQ